MNRKRDELIKSLSGQAAGQVSMDEDLKQYRRKIEEQVRRSRVMAVVLAVEYLERLTGFFRRPFICDFDVDLRSRRAWLRSRSSLRKLRRAKTRWTAIWRPSRRRWRARRRCGQLPRRSCGTHRGRSATLSMRPTLTRLVWYWHSFLNREIKKAVADAAAREAKLQVTADKRDKGALLDATSQVLRARRLMPTGPLCSGLYCR